jgi:hypothetical protein
MSLHAITTYFNPCRYRTRRAHFDRFRAALDDSNVRCLTVEISFGDEEFELDPDRGIVQIRSGSLLWQKERLLNLAASWLPDHFDKVAWLDADILFQNPDWARDCDRVLDDVPIAQVWQRCDRLDSKRESTGDVVTSFAQRMQTEQALLDAGRYEVHGHTGYGWAMRRDVFRRVGLYEGAVSGSADHFMAHAIFDRYGTCVEGALKHDHRQLAHLKAWGRRFHACVQGRLGVVPGDLQHLWHGDLADRQYFSRMHAITDHGFDPWTDIVALPGRPLEWTDEAVSRKAGLTNFFQRYFATRKEDGHV